MKVNYNEGGKWFTLWVNTKSSMLFRVWLALHNRAGRVLVSFNVTAYNPSRCVDDHQEWYR